MRLRLHHPEDFQLTPGFTQRRDASQKILSKWGDQGSFSGQRSYSFGTEPGLSLAFSISDLANQNNGAFHTFMVAGVLTLNTWNHVAATYNSAAGIRSMYVNGMKVASHTNAPVPVYNSIATETIGAWLRAPGSIEGYFHGSIDEVSLYGRFMSDSEIKAIYTDGTAGKFDPNAAIPQNLAKAAVSINGAPANIYFGNNGGWQVQNIQLTATQVATPVVITGLEPGILLDSFSASRTVGGNLYYLPEQSLDPLIGTSAYGTWQLEIQDDRVGATNRTILQSWALQFVFANTNPIPALINSGNTNFIPPGGLGVVSGGCADERGTLPRTS
ncbi:MAG: LamG domain-containing protein [Limisphaerales bacterium]